MDTTRADDGRAVSSAEELTRDEGATLDKLSELDDTIEPVELAAVPVELVEDEQLPSALRRARGREGV